MISVALTVWDRSKHVNITSYGQNAENGCLKQVTSVFVTVLCNELWHFHALLPTSMDERWIISPSNVRRVLSRWIHRVSIDVLRTNRPVKLPQQNRIELNAWQLRLSRWPQISSSVQKGQGFIAFTKPALFIFSHPHTALACQVSIALPSTQ